MLNFKFVRHFSLLVVLSGVLSACTSSPDEIERIEVVKGEAALERFGPEAAAGVVEIFLKETASPDPGG